MQALALKYRPRQFDKLIGQEVVCGSLSRALEDKRLSHAYLFSGLRGSGKTSSARIFAKALLCENGPTSTPCDSCSNCIMANESRHLDIIEMDAASHRKIDDVRELIEHTRYSPSQARFKIFIIDEVHMLTKEAFNALLKTLEEPPSYVKFILATTDPLKLPTTILSRTQHFRFKAISKNLTVNHLRQIMEQEGIKYENSALEILARSGGGSLRDTLTLLDQAIIFSGNNVDELSVTQMLGLLDPAKIDEIMQIVISQDRQRALDVINELVDHDAQTIIDDLIENVKAKFLSKDSSYSLLMYERFFRILSEAKGMLFIGADSTFALSMTIFMLMEAVNLRKIDEMISIAQTQNIAPLAQKNERITHEAVEIIKPVAKGSVYDEFLRNLSDRDADLGECFKEVIGFISFENSVVKLSSSAQGKNRDILRNSSRAINDVLKKTFGANAKIEIIHSHASSNSDFDENITKTLEKFSITQNENKDLKNVALEALDELKNSTNLQTDLNKTALIDECDRLFGAHTVEQS